METLLLCAMVVVLLAFVLKLSLLSFKLQALVATAVALLLALSSDAAASQSRTQIAAWIATPDLMREVSVVLSFDLALLFTFCVMRAKADALSPRQQWLLRLLSAFPSLLTLLVGFALLVMIIFALPGVDFTLTSIAVALLSLLIALSASAALRWLLPEVELRLELLFLLALLLSLMGVVVTVDGQTAVRGTDSASLSAHLAVLGLLLAFALVGYLVYRFQAWRERKAIMPRR